MIKKHNAVLLAAIALAFGANAANAATSVSTTAVTYAVEQFKGTAPGSAAVAPTLNIVASTAIPTGSTVTVMVQLTGGIFSAAPAATAAVGAGGAQAAQAVIAGTTAAGAAAAVYGGATGTAAGANADVLVLQFTTTGAVGIGGTLASITTPSINASGLAVTGALVQANASVFVGTVAAPVGAAVPTTGLLEAASGLTTVATSAQGITVATATAASSQKIDLTATPVATVFTTTGVASATDTGSARSILLGRFNITDGTAKLITAGNAAYATGAKTSIATVTGPAGLFSALGTTGTITVNAPAATACGGAAAATSATFGTNALAAAATSIALPATNFAGVVAPGATYDVCMHLPVAPNSIAMIEGAPSVGVVLGAAAAADSADTLATTALQALAFNGQSVDVRNYVPAANVGWTQYLRVINTGAVAAPIHAAVINETTGAVGASVVLIPSLAAGAATSLSATQIEAAIGAQAIAARPRIRISGATNGLEVQNILFTPNGSFTAMQGKE